jgi:hypothetical protein
MFRHRVITQSEPATPIDLLAAQISTAEACNVEGDVREVNIITFEPDLPTSFDDPVPWDVMPTSMSDIPTQIYGSADFPSAIKQLCLDFADIFCREVKSEPARVEPLKVDIEWERWRIPRNVLSRRKRWRRRGHRSSGCSSWISSNPQNRRTTVICTWYVKRQESGVTALTVTHKSFLSPAEVNASGVHTQVAVRVSART